MDQHSKIENLLKKLNDLNSLAKSLQSEHLDLAHGRALFDPIIKMFLLRNMVCQKMLTLSNIHPLSQELKEFKDRSQSEFLTQKKNPVSVLAFSESKQLHNLMTCHRPRVH